jgi:uncharacterized tellurite resistance protein B-like protein
MAGSEQDLLRLALSVHLARLVVHADDVLDYHELTWFERVYPSERLAAAGLIDADGHFTDAFENARIEAALELPGTLTLDDKLSMLSAVYQAALADGVLEVTEYKVLLRAATLLAVSEAQLSAHLDVLAGVDAPAPRRS